MLLDGLNHCGFLIAQADGAAANGQQAPWWLTNAPLIAMGVLFVMIIMLPQRREQAKREQMLNSMKKNDRVVTIGGIIGTVANISADGKEVTLKVDDNTRIKFLRSSISQVLGEETKDDPAAKTA